MAVSKVVTSDGRTIIDISDSDVTAETLIKNNIGYGSDGQVVEGSNPYELNSTNNEVDTQADLISQISTVLEGKAIPDDYIQPSGTLNITENGTYDVTNYASAVVNVQGATPQTPTAGDNPVVENASLGRINATSLTSTGISITIPVSGTYRLKWSAFRTSTSGTNSTRLYRTRNGQTTAIGTEITSWTNSYYINGSLDVQLNAGDVITVYARARGSSYYVCAGNLSACVEQPHVLVD